MFLYHLATHSIILVQLQKMTHHYIAVFDLGTDKGPHVTDRKLRLWVSETGFNNSVMYSGLRFFIAL